MHKKHEAPIEITIIGAGFTGLLIAAGLKRQGHTVQLLDGVDLAGGTTRKVQSPLGFVDNGLKFLTSEMDANLDEQHIELMRSATGLPLTFEKVINSPITFSHGEMKPFVGFGATAPEFHKPLSYFLKPERYEILHDGHEIKLHHLITYLVEYLSESFQPRSQVTQMIHNQEGQVSHLLINGTKTLPVQKVIYCAHPKFFNLLFSNQTLHPRIRQKLSKGVYWTAICLDLFHKEEVTTSKDLHLLNGTTQDELGPCVGLFHKAQFSDEQNSIIQHSQWLTYIEHDAVEEAEVVASALKKMKRQIKRAYHQALDQVIFERIAVLPCREAEIDLKLAEDGLLQGFNNLWIASGTWTDKSNLHGCLSQVRNVLNSFQETSTEVVQVENPQGENILDFSP